MKELVDVQFALFSYLCALTGNTQDAHDILQEANLKICREAARYDPGRPFIAWAKTIVFYEVMTYRKKQRRERLVFDDSTFETIAAQTEVKPYEVNRHLARLEGCIQKLPETLHRVVEARYLKGFAVQEIAAQLERSENAVSLLLMRARQALADCVRKPDEEEVPV
ncbi:MAG: sigma-70 family RNA polymerase sigma factor [bacterium]